MVAYSFKKRFIEPILTGLGIALHSFSDLPPPGALGKRRHARPGEAVQLYTAMRTKQCRKIGDARCVSVEGVLLKWSEWPSFCTFDIIELDGRAKRHGPTRPIDDMEEFARLDGFPDLAAMRKFWADEHGGATFEGVLIKWEAANGE